MAWVFGSGKMCYSGSGDEILAQNNVFMPGQNYIIKLMLSDVTSGYITIKSLTDEIEISDNGIHAIYGEALSTSLIIEASDSFIGCVDNIEAYLVPDVDSLEFDYISQCLNIQTDQGCLLHIAATNSNDSLNFNWDDLILSMRLNGKFAKVDYNGTQKETSLDSSGNLTPIYFNGNRTRSLLIEAAPVWVHDFLYMCMAVDGLEINGEQYIIQENDYPEIEWNKKFTEGTVELQVRKRIYKLNRSNC